MQRYVRRTLQSVGIGVGVLLLLIVLAFALLDSDVFRHPLERLASARSGRSVTIAGRLEAHLWSWTPGIVINGLTVGNPPWDSGPPLLKTRQLLMQVHLLPLLRGQVIVERLELREPQVYLHRDTKGHANWTFESQKPSQAPSTKPTRVPIIRNLAVEDGHMRVRDEILHLDINAKVAAAEKRGADDPHAFHFEGEGSVNRQPLRIEANGGPLVAVDPHRPYPFVLQIVAGDVHLDADGVVRKPFDLGQMGLVFRVSGNDLADFYYLTQLALPNTPPFKLQASVERDGNHIRVENLAGRIGDSDLHGRLLVDLTRKRPRLTGELASAQLRLKDLAASLGGKAAGPESPTPTLTKAEKPATTQAHHVPAPQATVAPDKRLFPDARLQVNRVRAMDADVRFSAHAIDAGSVNMKEVALHVKLNEGVLSLEPFEFVMPQGRLYGTLSIDARKQVPDTHLDMHISDIQLQQFKGKAQPASDAPLEGDLEARIVMDGRGDSVHDFVSDASGKVTFVLPHGEMSSAFAELTGIDVANGLGLLLKGNDKKVPVRCGVAQFAVQDGVMRAQTVVFDTQNVLITGSGDIKLGPEELDMSIKGQPKKPRIGRLHTPIKIHGHLLKPSVGVSAADTVKQGAVAAALGALISPLAAVIAFVDPGLAKNADCASLLASAQSGPAAPRL